MSFLTSKTVVIEAEKKVDELRTKIDDQRASARSLLEHAPSGNNWIQTSNSREQLSRIVDDTLAAGQALQREWFCDSVGIEWDSDDRETWYICRAPVAAKFSDCNVVHWTNWIGRICTQIREYLDEHGKFPDLIRYGPPSRECTRAVGPWVRYQFANGRLTQHEFKDATGAVIPHQPEPATEKPAPTATDAVTPVFGLKDIVDLRDLAQDDQIRGPMAGTYILTGGPGSGKTSVALHRIPYLLLEQKTQLKIEVPDVQTDFFSVDTMHVVVWTEQLVPHLQSCLSNLHFDRVPVYHVEEWVARLLREQISIGKGKGKNQYQITDETAELRQVKEGADGTAGRWAGLNERILESYLIGLDRDGHFHNPRAEVAAAELQELVAEVNESFADHPLSPQLGVPRPTAAATAEGIEMAIAVIRNRLGQLTEEVSDKIRMIKNPVRGRSGTAADARPYELMRPVITKAREAIATARTRLVSQITSNYPTLLAEFYSSDIVAESVASYFGRDVADRFAREARERISDYRLSKFDRYLLLWTIQILTRGVHTDQAVAKPLPQYSHTMIDEAQYYHPLVLRLLVDLSRPPLRSMTIVGDLEQKVSNDGGLIAWEDAGIRVEKSNIIRLNTNYRWSTAVYRFLDIYRILTGLWELKEPRHWASGAGVDPEIVACTDADQEVDWLVERISQIRPKNWSILVVVPHGIGDGWQAKLVHELAMCDIRSRWAIKEDVRECEKVIITNYDNIVGLEFDAVFLPSCHRVLAPPAPDRAAIQAAWVALTRARKFIAVSHTDRLAIFADEAFAAYRS